MNRKHRPLCAISRLASLMMLAFFLSFGQTSRAGILSDIAKFLEGSVGGVAEEGTDTTRDSAKDLVGATARALKGLIALPFRIANTVATGGKSTEERIEKERAAEEEEYEIEYVEVEEDSTGVSLPDDREVKTKKPVRKVKRVRRVVDEEGQGPTKPARTKKAVRKSAEKAGAEPEVKEKTAQDLADEEEIRSGMEKVTDFFEGVGTGLAQESTGATGEAVSDLVDAAGNTLKALVVLPFRIINSAASGGKSTDRRKAAEKEREKHELEDLEEELEEEANQK